MKTLTFQELTRDQRRKALAAYGQLASEKIYKQSDSGTLFTTTANSSGVVSLVQIGEELNANVTGAKRTVDGMVN